MSGLRGERMVLVDGEPLFGAARAAVIDQGVKLRWTGHEAPGADGAQVTGGGREARVVEQRGTLTGEDRAALAARIAQIEQRVSQAPLELREQAGRVWSNMVLVAFEPGRLRKLGGRWAATYRAQYVQDGGG